MVMMTSFDRSMEVRSNRETNLEKDQKSENSGALSTFCRMGEGQQSLVTLFHSNVGRSTKKSDCFLDQTKIRAAIVGTVVNELHPSSLS
mmetsp:Transcript_9891/g.21503  ORF Transcript_9891/g.21503 Transcript_9891/m.21503 type:complete len:89 (-) Transcript_9891:56-322(-)